MLSRAALLYDQGQDWVVEQIEVDPPKADEVIGSAPTYDLDDVNEGYRAMRDGENIRGVITYG